MLSRYLALILIALILSMAGWGCSSGSETQPEDNAAACDDGLDNDQDGQTDCDDSGCKPLPVCAPPPTEDDAVTCDDDLDNDQDGQTDCDDSGCKPLPVCAPPPTEDDAVTCDDDLDNDLDGQTDCDDSGCKPLPVCAPPPREDDAVTCDDDLDNDLDGQTDCLDSGCEPLPVCAPLPTEDDDATCADDLDNDQDGSTDCDDPGCVVPDVSVCQPEDTEDTDALCADGQDNDGDGYIDCLDFNCSRNPLVTVCRTGQPEDTDLLCSDSFDNDGDGYTDCVDYDCSDNPLVLVCSALGPENSDGRCADAADNDGDGATDCADPDCASTTPCRPTEAEDTDARCLDSVDNDGDGATDCADRSCSWNPAVTACQPASESSDALCADGVDNDRDGASDCADLDCARDPAVTVCGAGLAIGAADTLELATWNLRNFPLDTTTGTRVVWLMEQMQLDLIEVEEIADEAAFWAMEAGLQGYDAVLSTDEYSPGNYQKVGFLYRTAQVQAGTPELLFEDDGYAFPRPPLQVRFTVQRPGGGTLQLLVIAVHLKASSGADNEARRLQAVVKLKAHVDALLAAGEQNVVILGDWNDELQDPPASNVFASLLQDYSNYQVLTWPVAVRGGISYVPYWRLLDHLVVTTALRELAEGGATFPVPLDLMTEVIGFDYLDRVSDHRPVVALFPF